MEYYINYQCSDGRNRTGAVR